MLKTKTFFGLKIVNESWQQWQEELKEMMRREQLTIIMTPNPEQIMRARRDEMFLANLQKADWLIPDGEGLIWAAKLKERLTGSDTVKEILSLVKEEKKKVLLIGGRYQADENNELKLRLQKQRVTINYASAYKNVRKKTNEEEKKLKETIEKLKPEVVLVAFGAPEQEKWLIEHKELLKQNGTHLAMVVGGSFDFLTGKLKRAPYSWQKARLEWLWRLLQEPQRAKRQLVLPQFAWLVLTKKIR